MLPCGEAGSHGHPGPSLGHSLICTSRRWPAVLQTQCWTSAGGPARAGGAAGGSGLAAVTGGFRGCPRRSRSGPPGKRSPAAGRRAAGADLGPAREDLVTQCASSATAPARLPPARAASLSGIARAARWLGTLRPLSREGSSATALSCPCPHPTAEAAPTHRRSPRGCAVGAGSQERRGRCRSRAAFAVTRSSELSGLGRRRLPQQQSVCMTIGATRGEAVALALRLLLLASRGAVGLSPAPAGAPPPPGDAEEGGAVLRPVQGAETTAGT